MRSPHDPLDADVPARSVRVHASLPAAGRRSRVAAFISFLLHAVIIYLAIRLTATVALPEHSPIGDAIKMVLGGGGGGGKGGATFAHTVPPPPPVAPPIRPTPLPVVAQTPPPVVPPPAPVAAPPPAAASPATAGTGGGTGGGTGTGEGPGSGSGRGPGSGGGSGGGNGGGNAGSPPESKQMIIPPVDGVPKELRGKTVEVTFFVTAAGLVSDVKVAPPIANNGYARKFDEVMRGYTFKPARDPAGNRIAGTTTVQVSFGGK